MCKEIQEDINITEKSYYLCDRKRCDKCFDECHLTSDLFHAVDGINRAKFEVAQFKAMGNGNVPRHDPFNPSFKSQLLNPFAKGEQQ
jgi:hypothetical protein